MELSNDWHKRTNVRLVDILSDIMKESRPPKVPKPTHGYTIAETAPEVVTAPGVYFPAEKGRVIPLESRQSGGAVTPAPTRTLQQMLEKLALYAPFPFKGAAAQSTAARGRVEGQGEDKFETAIGMSEPKQVPLNVSPVPAPSLQSYAPPDLTPIGPSAPPTGMAEYEASAGRMRGSSTPTTLSTAGPTATVNPTDKRLGQITGFLRSSMKPLFSRAPGGPTSPDPLEGLSEEERAKLLKLYGGHGNVVDLAPNESGVFEAKTTPSSSPDNMTNVMAKGEITIPKIEPIRQIEPLKQIEGGATGNLSEIRKDILPLGETLYTLPGTEGTATVGPERFFAGKKEVPAGTRGAVSGDELARQRIASTSYSNPELEERKKWATPGYGEARLAEAQKKGGMISIKGGPPTPSVIGVSPGYERTYYEAHPEERSMDLARAENKPLLDAFNKLREENSRRAQGFGLIGMSPKAAALTRAEATRAVPELTQGLERMMASNQNVPEKYFSAETRVTEAERRGVAAAEARAAASRATAERNPTELSLIAKAGEKGSDGKPTAEATEAQRILDDEKKRKIDIQGGGIPILTNIPPLPVGQKYNEAALEGVDAGVKETIKKIVTYDIPLPSAFALSKPYWQNIIARASAYDPSFSALQYPVKFGVRKSFTSGKDKDNLVALNTAVGHINSLVKAKDELANSNWQMGNAAANILAKYFPVTEGLVERQGTVTGVKTKFNAVKGEMANIFKRSGATDQEIKSWNDTITDPSTATPASWKAFINGSLELMGSRIEALRSIYERGIGAPKDFAFLSDKSRGILKGLGVDVNAIDPVAGSEEGATPAEKKPSAADFGGNLEGGGEVKRTVGGKSYVKRDGKWYEE